MKPSTLGARYRGPRAGRRFDAERGIVTEALIFLGDLDPDAVGPNIAHATHYEPTPVGDLGPLLSLVPFPIEDACFVDFGAGMGRALLLAAERPFRTVLGVEFSPALVAIARENLARAERGGLACRDLRIRRADAADARLPAGDVVGYLFNPFDRVVLGAVLDRLAHRARTHRVALVYHTPAERTMLDADPRCTLVGEIDCGCVYRVRAPGVRPERAAPESPS